MHFSITTLHSMNLRERLVSIALEWQQQYGVAPAITPTLAEYDAAILIGCPDCVYGNYMQDRTAVSRGHDFIHDSIRYQVKGSRPSGKKGSPVTKVAKSTNTDWDFLIWIHYTQGYVMREAWQWSREDYIRDIAPLKRVSPMDMRKGKCLFPAPE